MAFVELGFSVQTTAEVIFNIRSRALSFWLRLYSYVAKLLRNEHNNFYF